VKRFVFSALMFAIITPAFAVDLSIGLTEKILTADGLAKKECMESDPANPSACKTFRDLTVGIVAIEALSYPDQSIKGDAAARNGALAIKLAGKDSVELTLDEATQIKTQVGKFFDPVTVARMWAILEPRKSEGK
jgi:hypothetical protein